MEWLLELSLIGLLSVTLFHAVRLERALGVLKRDRTALQGLVDEFNASTRAAEQGIDGLRAATEGAGRVLLRQIETAKAQQDDLVFMVERAERLADRLEGLVRSGRPLQQEVVAAEQRAPIAARATARPRSQAELDLMKALNLSQS